MEGECKRKGKLVNSLELEKKMLHRQIIENRCRIMFWREFGKNDNWWNCARYHFLCESADDNMLLCNDSWVSCGFKCGFTPHTLCFYFLSLDQTVRWFFFSCSMCKMWFYATYFVLPFLIIRSDCQKIFFSCSKLIVFLTNIPESLC